MKSSAVTVPTLLTRIVVLNEQRTSSLVLFAEVGHGRANFNEIYTVIAHV